MPAPLNMLDAAFSAADEVMEAVALEYFRIEGGGEWSAIAMETLTVETRAALGGTFAAATLTIHVRQSIIEQSGVAKGTLLHARSQRLRVQQAPVMDRASGAFVLVCGPATVEVPR